MTLKQLWSIIRGRRTNFSCANASWTYYPDGDPMTHQLLDIVDELRNEAIFDPVRQKAADEIERLRAIVGELPQETAESGNGG
ncbi:MAG TPA: hypothetical protein VIM11_26795 [Tepidisphaeraceae bacterium]|jgi:hypothetical protein